MSVQKPQNTISKPSVVANPAPSSCRGMRVAQAAAYAGGVTHWFIRSAIWAGQLKARRAGKVIIILKDDLDHFLNSLPVVEPNGADWLAKRQQKTESAA